MRPNMSLLLSGDGVTPILPLTGLLYLASVWNRLLGLKQMAHLTSNEDPEAKLCPIFSYGFPGVYIYLYPVLHIPICQPFP